MFNWIIRLHKKEMWGIMTNILITGINGLVGSYLAYYLSQDQDNKIPTHYSRPVCP